jgi:quinol monooxygenase YgiN
MPSVRRAACLLAVAALALPAPAALARGGEKPNPIVAKIKAALKHPTKPFTLLVRLQLKEGAGKKFETAFAKAARLTRKEKGCRAYTLDRDLKSPTHYLIYERWENFAALEAHLKTEYITALLKELGDLLEGAPEMQVLVPAGD